MSRASHDRRKLERKKARIAKWPEEDYLDLTVHTESEKRIFFTEPQRRDLSKLLMKEFGDGLRSLNESLNRSFYGLKDLGAQFQGLILDRLVIDEMVNYPLTDPECTAKVIGQETDK